MDVWYHANARAGTLPEGFTGETLREITEALGLGYHAVVPDFTEQGAEATVDRLLGIYRVRESPFRVSLGDVERKVESEGGATRVTYRTRRGSVSGVFGWTEEMLAGGATLPWVFEALLKSPEDFAVVEEIFRNVSVTPAAGRYDEWSRWVGGAGVAVAYGGPAGSPVHHILHQLMPATDFFLTMHDEPAHVEALARSLENYFDGMLAALCSSEAEIIFFGGNYDETITYPPFFEMHILPWLSKAGRAAHAAGKLLLTHTDGENAGLMGLYRQAGFDVADSFCPAPMTKMTLRNFAEALPEVTIWGGIPSVALVKTSMPDDTFARLLDETFEYADDNGRIILSIADTLPRDADWERFLEIVRRAGG